jgi:hypothetical protein
MDSSAGRMSKRGLTPTAYLIGAFVLFCSAVSGQSGPSPRVRQITVADDVLMTRLEGRDYATGRASVAHFSPNSSRFVVVTKKGNIDRDTTDFSLLLYDTASAFSSPTPNLLLKMSSSSDRNAISRVRWLSDNETLMFLGENPGETSQVYTVNIRSRLLRKITNHPTSILNYDATADGREIAFVADPPEGGLHPQVNPGKEIVIAGQTLTDILEGNTVPWEGRQVFLWREKTESSSPVSTGPEYSVSPATISLSPDGQYLLLPAHIRSLRSHREWINYEIPNLQHIFAANFPEGYISPVQQYLLVDTGTMSAVPLIDAPMIGVDPVSWAEDGKSVYLSSYLPLDAGADIDRTTRVKDKCVVAVAIPSREYKRMTGPAPSKRVENPPANVSVEEALNTPPKLYVTDREHQKRKLLLDLNPQLRFFGDLTLKILRQLVVVAILIGAGILQGRIEE